MNHNGGAQFICVSAGSSLRAVLSHNGGAQFICVSAGSALRAMLSHNGGAQLICVSAGSALRAVLSHNGGAQFICVSAGSALRAVLSHNGGALCEADLLCLALGRIYDERVDIFSFGIMLCEVSASKQGWAGLGGVRIIGVKV